MTKETQIRFAAVVFSLLTVTAVVFAWINFQKEREFSTPTDGVWWVESHGQLVAQRVDPLGPGDRGGIKAGRCTGIRGRQSGAQQRRCGAPDVSLRRLDQALLHLGARQRQPGCPGDSAAGGQELESGIAADCTGVPVHWDVCAAAPLDRAESRPLLPVLPGFIHLLLLQIHRQAEPV